MAEKQTHDYLRHGTTSPYAALEVATGKLTDNYYERHTNAESLVTLTRQTSTPTYWSTFIGPSSPGDLAVGCFRPQ